MIGSLSLGLGLGLGPRLKTGLPGIGVPGPRVFLMIGQSNMIGRRAFDGGAPHPAGVLQWGRAAPNDGILIPASNPLEHVNPTPGHMGLDITFSIDYVDANPENTLILVPAAQGGASLQSGTWMKGGARYEDAVARANLAVAAMPGARFAGFIWHQGESDAGNASYQAQLDQVIADFRQDVDGADIAPFVLGTFSGGYVGTDPERIAIRDIIADTPNRVSRTAVVDAADLTVYDGIHFDAVSLRLLGERYFDAFASLVVIPPVAIGSIPDQTDLTALTPPVTVGSIPDQTDSVSLTPPSAVGFIPDQMDVAA
ncbi:MAG: sialate O-acetylesterase [Pseudomonadota bacterium]